MSNQPALFDITPTATIPDLTGWDIILLNTSAGKDSLVAMATAVAEAERQGVFDRLVAVHCDLGRVEWTGTRELAERHAAHFGIPLHVVTRPQGDLLTHVEKRGKWMGPQTRFCTSDHKTGQVSVLMTKLVQDFIAAHWPETRRKDRRRVRVLNVLGFRAQESDDRAAEPEYIADYKGSNATVREVGQWLPVKWWSLEDVWSFIHASGLEYHRAYALGMPRLSCVFCFFAPKDALLLAGYHNPALLADYVRLEARIGHDFKFGAPLIQIQNQLAAGYIPGKVSTWSDCSAAA